MKFHNIEPNNIENGTGIRTVLWVSGCYHNCKGCHNPVTHDPEDGVTFDDDSMKELLNDLNNDYINGLTISGGDPLTYYPADTLDIINKVQNHFSGEKNVWLYTGFTLDWLINEILNNPDPDVKSVYTDILLRVDVLCDGKFEIDKISKDYHWVGSTNQRVINMKQTLEEGEVKFEEPEQESICTFDNSETNELLKKFKVYLDTL